MKENQNNLTQVAVLGIFFVFCAVGSVFAAGMTDCEDGEQASPPVQQVSPKVSQAEQPLIVENWTLYADKKTSPKEKASKSKTAKKHPKKVSAPVLAYNVENWTLQERTKRATKVVTPAHPKSAWIAHQDLFTENWTLPKASRKCSSTEKKATVQTKEYLAER